MNLPSDILALPSHFINGVGVYPATALKAGGIESIDPYTGERLWRGEAASDSTVDQAVAAAKAAFPAWAATDYRARLEVLTRFVELVKANSQDLTNLIAREAGKPLWEAAQEANSLVTKLSASVEAYETRAAESSRVVRGMTSRTRFLPHGVMAVLGPFNFPASMSNSHITPALLSGNTVVFKPSELTPLTGLAVSRLWQLAGLPPGVMNCVSGGSATGKRLVAHPDVNGVLLVGSHRAGMSILAELAGKPEKIVSVEMGGNSPLVIWDYDDLDAVVSIIIQSAFMSSGQRCTAARRLLVREDDVALIPRLLEVIRSMRIGDSAQSPEPYYGPMIRPKAAQAASDRFDDLVAGGAKAISPPVRSGPIQSVMTPGLLDMDDVASDPDEEIFGPILKVYRYRSLEQAFALANQTRFGLAAGIVCGDRATFEAFLRTVRAGLVNWNKPLTGATTLAPFGGVKQSGNFRPAGFLSVDYCSYGIATFEVDQPSVPNPAIPGISF